MDFEYHSELNITLTSPMIITQLYTPKTWKTKQSKKPGEKSDIYLSFIYKHYLFMKNEAMLRSQKIHESCLKSTIVDYLEYL